MKKILTYLILVLSILSCREKHVQPEATPAAISFASPEVMQTKSVLIENKSQLLTGDGELGFSVFAAKYIPSEAGQITQHSQFMDDVKVYSTDGGATWRYDGSYYWSPGAIHKFFAVYPYYENEGEDKDEYDLGLEYAINEDEHVLEATGKSSIVAGEIVKGFIYTGLNSSGENICPDILYGVKKYSEPYSLKENRESIKFELSHAMSAVSFRIRNASDYNINRITAGKIQHFKNALEYVWLSDDGPAWGSLTIDDNYTFDVPDIQGTVSPGTYYPDASTFWCTVLMIPQDFGSLQSNPSFTFVVDFDTIADKEYTVNFKDYQLHNNAEHAFSFLSGYRYIYNFNVTSSAISCHVDIVPWIEDEPIHLN